MACRQLEPGASPAIRQASRRRRGAAAVETGGSRRSSHRVHRGVFACPERERGEGSTGGAGIGRGCQSSGRSGEPARATHALCGHRRDGAGSFGWCWRVRRVQGAEGSKPASRASADERGQGKVGRAAGAFGTRPGPAQPVAFAFSSFAANHSEWRYRCRGLAGARSAADWHILLQPSIHRGSGDCALQGFVGPLPNQGLPPPCRRFTRNFQSERRPHCHLILRQHCAHLGPVQRYRDCGLEGPQRTGRESRIQSRRKSHCHRRQRRHCAHLGRYLWGAAFCASAGRRFSYGDFQPERQPSADCGGWVEAHSGMLNRNESPECKEPRCAGCLQSGWPKLRNRHMAATFDLECGRWRADPGVSMDSGPYSVAFSPDGSRLLIGAWGTISYGNISSLWDVSKGTEIARLTGHQSDTQLQGVMFSHDGGRIATVSLDGTARLWDGISGQLRGLLGQESSGLKMAHVAADEQDLEMNSAFSSDDRLLATASFDGTVRIWDVERASLLTTISGHSGLVEHVEFSPADNSLLTASHDGTARLWDTDGVLTTTLLSQESSDLRGVQSRQRAPGDWRSGWCGAPVGGCKRTRNRHA